MKRNKIVTVVLAGAMALAQPVSILADEADTATLTTVERIALLESKEGETEAYLEELNTQLADLNDDLDTLGESTEATEAALEALELDLAAANVEEAEQRESMALRIQYIYENDMSAGILSALFDADDFLSFISDATLIAELNEVDREMLSDYQDVCCRIADDQAQTLEEKANLKSLREQTSIKIMEIQELYDSASDELDEIRSSLEEEAKAATREAELMSMIAVREAELQNVITIRSYADNAETGSSVDSTVGTADLAYQETASAEETTYSGNTVLIANENWSGDVLNTVSGFITGPSGTETYYNLDMSGIVDMMHNMGYNETYWVRSDGVKMFGDYVMVAANLDVHPRGSIVESSLGTAIVCDTGGFAVNYPNHLDVATSW